jgi:hypothetical protein
MCYLGLIACICLKDYDSLFTGHVARQIYKTGDVTSSNETVETPKVESVSEGQAEKASISAERNLKLRLRKLPLLLRRNKWLAHTYPQT